MLIADIVRRNAREVVHISLGKRVSDVVRLLAERRVGAVPVMDGDRVAGIFSERDLVTHIAREGAEVLEWPVERVMSQPAITVAPDLSILSALALITARRFRHLPVVEGDSLIAIVSIGDLVKARIDGIEAEAGALRDYIQSA